MSRGALLLRWGAGFVALALVGLALGAHLYRSGNLRFNHPSRSRFPVRGLDVSHHQGAVDWAAVRASGFEFAFIKATEGADFADRRFAQNWSAAGKAGVARGAYHFFTFCTPGALQADHFTAALAGLDPELPPAADVEFSGNCRGWTGIEAIRVELAVFLDRVQEALGREPLLYLTAESQRRIVDARFADYEVWIRDIFFEPSQPRFGAWAFWQYADNGRVRGVTGPVDLNAFCCSRQRFLGLAPGP